MKIVGYVLVERLSVPGDPNSPKLVYAQPKSTGTITFQELAEEIGGISTTVSDTDVLAVLNEADKAVARHLEL
ncbi:hypothetical protein FACS189435_4220 [Bacteroidia bacterium]|nr:hypothetical protein FACS189435_4220 [Bacteroidia bacterium]